MPPSYHRFGIDGIHGHVTSLSKTNQPPNQCVNELNTSPRTTKIAARALRNEIIKHWLDIRLRLSTQAVNVLFPPPWRTDPVVSLRSTTHGKQSSMVHVEGE